MSWEWIRLLVVGLKSHHHGDTDGNDGNDGDDATDDPTTAQEAIPPAPPFFPMDDSSTMATALIRLAPVPATLNLLFEVGRDGGNVADPASRSKKKSSRSANSTYTAHFK
jgi:hypothetical protein